MTTNTDPVRALAELVDAAALMLCEIDTCGHPVDPAYRATLHDAWTKGQAALASAPPSATVGVEAYLVERLGGEGYGNTRSIIDAAFYDPTKPAFWSSPEAQARHRVTPLVPALAQQPAAPEGCGACGDGCANRSGGCRLAEENPPAQPAAPSGEAVAWLRMKPDGTPDWAEDCIGSDNQFLDHEMASDGYYLQPLYAAPQQPAGVDGDEVRRVAQHIGAAADYIDKAYPDSNMLDRGPILRNMRRWHARLTAALAAQQPATVDEAPTWSRQQPTVPGIYGIRGFNLCRPASEQFEAVVVVREHGGGLVCNLHESTSEDDLESWAPICDLDPDFEWRVFVPWWQQQGGA